MSIDRVSARPQPNIRPPSGLIIQRQRPIVKVLKVHTSHQIEINNDQTTERSNS